MFSCSQICWEQRERICQAEYTNSLHRLLMERDSRGRLLFDTYDRRYITTTLKIFLNKQEKKKRKELLQVL